MYQYHDFEYVNFILNLPFNEGIELYNLCIGRFNDNMLFELFKCEIIRGTFEGSFEDYKKLQIQNIENPITNIKERNQEEKRIIEKIINIEKRRVENNG